MRTGSWKGEARRLARLRWALGAAGAVTLAACEDPSGPAVAAVAELQSRGATAPARDRSPHREGFVTANGATLHYLDWGGKGPPLVLLTGLGETAHIFDDIAPRLTPRYRVVAITRRGWGQGSRPTSGFGVDTLVDDDLAVLDALGLPRVYLAGHSIAAHELTRMAVRYPERVARLVYLDGSLNDRPASEACGGGGGRTGASVATAAPATAAVTLEEVLTPPPPTAADAASFAAAERYYQRVVAGPWTAAQANNLAHILSVVDASGAVAPNTDDLTYALMGAGICAYRHEFTSLRMPALAIAAVAGSIPDVMPWLPATMSADSLAAAQQVITLQQASAHANMAAFAAAVPLATTLLVQNTNHYLFIKSEREVVAALRGFLPKRLPPSDVAASPHAPTEGW